MNPILRISAVAGLGLLLGGCGSGGNSGGSSSSSQTLADHDKMLADDLTSTQSDLDTHKTAVNGATTVSAATSGEGAHDTKMQDHLSAMSNMLNDMSMCKDNGKTYDTSAMANAIAKMKSECDAHKSAMATQADLAAAKAEEDRHQKAVADQMAVMQAEHDKLLGTASSYKCDMVM